MELSELRAALLGELCRDVPEGTRVIGREIGQGVVMRDVSNPGQMQVMFARELVEGILSCLEGGDTRVLRREDIQRVQRHAEEHFALQRQATLFPQVGGLLEEDCATVRTVLSRALNSTPE